MKKAPLEGIRIIEMGQLLAVPHAARMLADLGAEVIKIESALRLDSHRQTTYPDNVPGERFWDRGGTFYNENRGKFGITLDLRLQEAKDVFLDLVRISDVVMENFTTRVMTNFGFDYESLVKVKPDLIMISSTGYGHTGPWANYRAIGPTTEPASGLDAVTGYEGGMPLMPDIPYTDYIAAEQTVLAILLALFRRKQTGKGSMVQISQVEAQASLLGELYLGASAGQAAFAPKGNAHEVLAPHGFYPCEGTDRWLAIAVASDAEWRSLCELMAQPEWATDPRFASPQARRENGHEIDEKLRAWTARFDAMELMRLLQSRGVAAGVALDGRDLLADEQLKQRGFWEWADHLPETGIEAKPFPGAPWRFSQSSRGAKRPAPALGQHNREVLTRVIGYSEEKVAELEALGVFGGTPEGFRKPRPVPLDVLQQQGYIREVDPDYRARLADLAEQP